MKAPTGTKFKTVNEYEAALPPASRKLFKQLRKLIREAAPGAEEIISYNIPSLKLNGGLIWFAMWKHHYSIYPKSVKMEAAIEELSAYDGDKGTIKFPLEKPIPSKLITKIVKFRVKENLELQKSRSRR